MEVSADPEPRSAPTAVLLVNLGTPDDPSVGAVRRYLREFLSDPRVLDMNPVGRALLLHGVILRTRPRRSAAAYAKVWTEAGSPLLVESRKLADRVAAELGDGFRVELAMRYGEPSIRTALDRLRAGGPGARLVVMPLFPQYSSAVTESTLVRVFELLGEDETKSFADVRAVPAFYDDPGFLASWEAIAREPLRAFAPDHVLLSYHGLPERQIRALDPSGSYCLEQAGCCDAISDRNTSCYRAQCYATSRGLTRVLGLDSSTTSVSFQSRLGRTPWIRPFTDEIVGELARQGVRRLAVLCPTFVADCLETLEEVGIRLREQWRELGGEELLLVPCPNADPTWVRAVADLVRRDA